MVAFLGVEAVVRGFHQEVGGCPCRVKVFKRILGGAMSRFIFLCLIICNVSCAPMYVPQFTGPLHEPQIEGWAIQLPPPVMEAGITPKSFTFELSIESIEIDNSIEIWVCTKFGAFSMSLSEFIGSDLFFLGAPFWLALDIKQ